MHSWRQNYCQIADSRVTSKTNTTTYSARVNGFLPCWPHCLGNPTCGVLPDVSHGLENPFDPLSSPWFPWGCWISSLVSLRPSCSTVPRQNCLCKNCLRHRFHWEAHRTTAPSVSKYEKQMSRKFLKRNVTKVSRSLLAWGKYFQICCLFKFAIPSTQKWACFY